MQLFIRNCTFLENVSFSVDPCMQQLLATPALRTHAHQSDCTRVMIGPAYACACQFVQVQPPDDSDCSDSALSIPDHVTINFSIVDGKPGQVNKMHKKLDPYCCLYQSQVNVLTVLSSVFNYVQKLQSGYIPRTSLEVSLCIDAEFKKKNLTCRGVSSK